MVTSLRFADTTSLTIFTSLCNNLTGGELRFSGDFRFRKRTHKTFSFHFSLLITPHENKSQVNNLSCLLFIIGAIHVFRVISCIMIKWFSIALRTELILLYSSVVRLGSLDVFSVQFVAMSDIVHLPAFTQIATIGQSLICFNHINGSTCLMLLSLTKHHFTHSLNVVYDLPRKEAISHRVYNYDGGRRRQDFPIYRLHCWGDTFFPEAQTTSSL